MRNRAHFCCIGYFVAKLLQVEVLVGESIARTEAIHRVRIIENNCQCWPKQCGGMGADQLRNLKHLQNENERLRKAVLDLTLEKFDLRGGRHWKGIGFACSRACTDWVRSRFYVSERQTCRVLLQHRLNQRKQLRCRADDDRLAADMINLVRHCGRYAYRRLAALLRNAGWHVKDK